MSIASEYADRVKAAKVAPVFINNGRYGIKEFATVDSDGDLKILGSTIDAKEALALAEWIVKTFGEKGKSSKI